MELNNQNRNSDPKSESDSKSPNSSGFRDYANVNNEDLSNNIVNSKSSTFPVRLFDLLSEVERLGWEWIVAWCPHGRGLLVRDQNAFEKQVLPLWFRQTKYASFQRQLNLYGFKRLTQGMDRGAYYHEKFLRSKRFLSFLIDRTKVKGSGYRKSADTESEPNFYAMTPLPGSHSSANTVSATRRLPESFASFPPGRMQRTVPTVATAIPVTRLANQPRDLISEQIFSNAAVPTGRTATMARLLEKLTIPQDAYTMLYQPSPADLANSVLPLSTTSSLYPILASALSTQDELLSRLSVLTHQRQQPLSVPQMNREALPMAERLVQIQAFEQMRSISRQEPRRQPMFPLRFNSSLTLQDLLGISNSVGRDLVSAPSRNSGETKRMSPQG